MLQTFTDFINSIFGQYQPCIVTDTNGNVIEGCINFGYIASVIIMLVFLYFVLKTIGGIIYEWLR